MRQLEFYLVSDFDEKGRPKPAEMTEAQKEASFDAFVGMFQAHEKRLKEVSK